MANRTHLTWQDFLVFGTCCVEWRSHSSQAVGLQSRDPTLAVSFDPARTAGQLAHIQTQKADGGLHRAMNAGDVRACFKRLGRHGLFMEHPGTGRWALPAAAERRLGLPLVEAGVLEKLLTPYSRETYKAMLVFAALRSIRSPGKVNRWFSVDDLVSITGMPARDVLTGLQKLVRGVTVKNKDGVAEEFQSDLLEDAGTGAQGSVVKRVTGGDPVFRWSLTPQGLLNADPALDVGALLAGEPANGKAVLPPSNGMDPVAYKASFPDSIGGEADAESPLMEASQEEDPHLVRVVVLEDSPSTTIWKAEVEISDRVAMCYMAQRERLTVAEWVEQELRKLVEQAQRFHSEHQAREQELRERERQTILRALTETERQENEVRQKKRVLLERLSSLA